MAIAYEGNTDLGFDTGVLRQAAREYKDVAAELRRMSSDLDKLLTELKDSGWTTPAGTAFHKMTSANWEKNIERYAALLDTLNGILIKAAGEYDTLMTDYVLATKINL